MLKNLVFDFGNVVVVFKPEEHLREYTHSDEEAMALRNLIWESKAWKDADIGNGNRQDTFERLCAEYPEKTELFRAILFQCSEWLVIPEETEACLRKLEAAGYNLYYITNTNAIDFDANMRNNVVLQEFEGGLASHLVQMNKPDHRIFQLLHHLSALCRSLGQLRKLLQR